MYNKLFHLESERLHEKLSSLNLLLQSLPPGSLQLKQQKDSTKLYIYHNHSLTYVNKKLHPIAEQLALKKYLLLQKEELENELQFFQHYLNSHPDTPASSDLLLSQNPIYQKLISSHYQSSQSTHQEWINAPFPQNPAHPEHLIHASHTGHMLRSKSEALIDLSLAMHRIPFRYECALTLGDITIYPDFTIMHPITLEIIYWEHFGMMDNEDYSNHTYRKLNLYNQHGYIPTINLITTFETKDHPLTLGTIEEIIQKYFL